LRDVLRSWEELIMLCENLVGATIRHFADSWTSSAGAAGNFISPISGLSANAFKTVIDIDTIGSVSRPVFFLDQANADCRIL
jgi:hypothetical protein